MFYHDFADCETAVEEMVNWLQIHQQPQSKLISFWRKTAKKRLTFIHNTEPTPDMNTILQQWPRYKDPEGFLLVSAYITFCETVLYHLLFILSDVIIQFCRPF